MKNRKVILRAENYYLGLSVIEYKIDPKELKWWQRIFNVWSPLYEFVKANPKYINSKQDILASMQPYIVENLDKDKVLKKLRNLIYDEVSLEKYIQGEQDAMEEAYDNYVEQ